MSLEKIFSEINAPTANIHRRDHDLETLFRKSEIEYNLTICATHIN